MHISQAMQVDSLRVQHLQEVLDSCLEVQERIKMTMCKHKVDLWVPAILRIALLSKVDYLQFSEERVTIDNMLHKITKEIQL